MQKKKKKILPFIFVSYLADTLLTACYATANFGSNLIIKPPKKLIFIIIITSKYEQMPNTCMTF